METYFLGFDSHEKRKRKLFLFLFFVLFLGNIKAEQPSPQLLLDSRISNDLFIPLLGKTFDSQAFIQRSSNQDFSSFDCSVSNTHNKIGSVFLVDAESYVCGYRYETSLSSRLRFNASVNGVSTGGGIFDSAISGWHDFFNFPNGHRTGSPNNQHHVEGSLENGGKFNLQEENFGILDPQIQFSYLLTQPGQSDGLYLNTGFSVPLQMSQFASKSPNFLLGLVYNKRSSKSSLSIGSNLSLRTDRSDLGLNYEQLSAEAFVGWVYGLSDNFSFVSNSSLQTSALRDVDGYPGATWYLDIGFRTDLIKSAPLEILLRENLYPSKASVDVSLILRVLSF